MLSKVYSVASIGLQALTIEIEVNAARGEPGIRIVGLANKSVQESQERVITALQNCGIRFPAKRIIINLAPADIPKEGPRFDLPIAMGILHALEIIQITEHTKPLFLGELSLNGEIRTVKGVLSAVLHAKKERFFSQIVIPYQNHKEVEIISGVEIHPIKHITQLIDHYKSGAKLPILHTKPFTHSQSEQYEIDFADIHGQESAKRAMMIAAAGDHNILLTGSPGAGKSMLAKAMVSILPPLTEKEAIEVTNIYSICGMARTGIITSRPFRSPHHTTSLVGLIGGGSTLKPGEISLSHRGVLFLDEFPEFSYSSLESLRQPLEDHKIHISRASGNTCYPARFTLVAAANPCPCGFQLSKTKPCSCSEFQIEKYQRKLSGPILDRIDLHVYVQEVQTQVLLNPHKHQSMRSIELKKHINRAKERQYKRFSSTSYVSNAELPSKAVLNFCQLSPQAKSFLAQAVERLHLSARSYFKIIKVAQTICDLSEGEEMWIDLPQISEALQYR